VHPRKPIYVLALCYIDTRRYDDARHAFARQYGFAPDSASAHLLAARMLLRRSYVPIAHDEATKALALDPSLPLAHLLLGEVALAGEHLDEAVAEFTAERDRNPLEGSAYERLGDAYIHKAEYVTAQKNLERAILLEPNSTGPYILLGKAFLKQGVSASAVGYLERARAMDGSNYMTHSLLGQAYRMQGRVDAARKETQLSQTLQADHTPVIEAPK
jgi:predicted Zn-dependent protease